MAALADASVREAVALWLTNSTAGLEAYGHISAWDTRAVTNMSRLFSTGVDLNLTAAFDEDLSAWETGNVITMECEASARPRV